MCGKEGRGESKERKEGRKEGRKGGGKGSGQVSLSSSLKLDFVLFILQCPYNLISLRDKFAAK